MILTQNVKDAQYTSTYVLLGTDLDRNKILTIIAIVLLLLTPMISWGCLFMANLDCGNHDFCSHGILESSC